MKIDIEKLKALYAEREDSFQADFIWQAACEKKLPALISELESARAELAALKAVQPERAELIAKLDYEKNRAGTMDTVMVSRNVLNEAIAALSAPVPDGHCDKCGIEVTTGMMAAICPRKTECEFWPEDKESQEFVESMRPIAASQGEPT